MNVPVFSMLSFKCTTVPVVCSLEKQMEAALDRSCFFWDRTFADPIQSCQADKNTQYNQCTLAWLGKLPNSGCADTVSTLKITEESSE